ncbi:corticoliberin-like [Anolis sagrei]|uniref:corticoliberin-like n=1 Tax=Anolis sagrei TaxID=38937 RepID=UPI003522C863
MANMRTYTPIREDLTTPSQADKPPSHISPSQSRAIMGSGCEFLLAGKADRRLGQAAGTKRGEQDTFLPDAAQVRTVQMVPAASFILLLFLPLKSCLPLEWPRSGSAQLLPLQSLSWERWPKRLEWEAIPSALPSSLEEGENPKDRLPPKACKLLGGEPTSQQQRTQRSPSSSKRRDGRPNSLDLTFHLLREFLEMSREERLAQKARSNKILLHNIGK